MKTVALKTWKAFELEVRKLEQDYIDLQKKNIATNNNIELPTPVYRGHADASWPLATTLERADRSELTHHLLIYYENILKVKSEIETFASTSFGIMPDLYQYRDWLESTGPITTAAKLPALDYMSYLRHYGFPSPLLDWSHSPFV